LALEKVLQLVRDVYRNATLEELGDHWSLLLVPNLMFFERRTFKDFLEAGDRPISSPTGCKGFRTKRSSPGSPIQKMAGNRSTV
jgi:hypothetical protein